MARTIIYSGEFASIPECWEVRIDNGDGTKHLRLFPKDQLNWRAAEYGIDPTDVDTLLDIIMHEDLVPTQMQEQRDPQLKANALPWLLEADNTDDARKYHLQRIRRATTQFHIKGNPALDAIRQGHKPDHELISRAKASVDVNRWMAKYGDLPVPPVKLQRSNPTPFVSTGIKALPGSSSTDSISSTTLVMG